MLDTVKARKLAHYGPIMRKQGQLSGERDNAWDNARCTQARKTTHGIDGQHQYVEESVRMTEINGESMSMMWPILRSTTANEQNRK